MAAGTVLAVSGLLGTYLAAIRPQPTYASPKAGSQFGQGMLRPSDSGVCPIADDTTVYDEASLRTAIAESNDDSVICIGAPITLSSQLQIADTTLTLVGPANGVTINLGGNRFVYATMGYNGFDDTLTIAHLTLRNGYAYSGGGAIFAKEDSSGGSALIVESSTFENNSAYYQGGAIWSSVPLEVIDSVFTGNVSTYHEGGAIFAQAALTAKNSVTVRNSQFVNNVANNGAGAINAGDTLEVSDSSFTGNKSYSGNGGALKVDKTAAIATSVFINNYTDGRGGAVSTTTGGSVESCLFYGNDAVDAGAALSINQGNSGNSVITSSSFIDNGDNTAPIFGGGVYKRSGGDLEISNSTFHGNGAAYGGAVAVGPLDRYRLTMTYTTIASNVAGTSGAGIFVGNNAQRVTVQNSILWSNYSGQYTDIEGNIGAVRLYNSTYTDANSISGIAPTNSVAGDPRLGALIDNGGPRIGRDSVAYLPTLIPGVGSPAIGIADASLTPTVTVDQIGVTRTSRTAGAINASSVPLAPTLNSVTGGNASLTLSWTLGSDGGSPVTDVEYSTDDSVTWRSVDDSTATTDTISLDSAGNPLVNGTTYQVRVRAVNSVGNGFDSNMLPGTPTNPTPPPPTPTFPPSAPSDVTGRPGDASATVTWTAPVSPGSFAITHYEAVARPGGSTCLVTAPTTGCTLTGLTNGTTYTVTVRALNGAGWGATATSGPVTPRPAATRPGPVQDLTVVEVTAAGTIELTWQPPLNDGGSPVTSYRVRYRQVGTEDYIRIRPNTPDTSITVTGLTPGQRYWVRVAARNDVGHGPGTRTNPRVRIPTE